MLTTIAVLTALALAGRSAPRAGRRPGGGAPLRRRDYAGEAMTARAGYLDHAATTPMLPEVLAAMTEQLGRVGNASSLHASGRAARRVAEEARERMAEALGARPSEVLFTGGGTESDNLAVKGLFWARRQADSRRRRIWSAPPSTTRCSTASSGWPSTTAPRSPGCGSSRPAGSRPDALAEALGDGTDVAVVSVMWANNEVGTVSDVAALAAVAHEVGVPLHTDAVQAVGQVPVDFAASGVDALTMTGHKLGGPMGVGVLLLRRDAECTPLLHGGGQERDVRSGTLDVAAIVGLAVADRRRGRLAARSAPRALADAARPAGRRRGRAGARRAAQRPAAGRRRRRRPGPAARQRAPVLPRRRGRRAADAAGRPRHRVLDRLGLQRRASRGPATCCSPWAPTPTARAARCGSPSGTPRPTPTSTRCSRRSGRSSSGPAAPGWAGR